MVKSYLQRQHREKVSELVGNLESFSRKWFLSRLSATDDRCFLTEILLEVYRIRTENLLCPEIQPLESFRRPPIFACPTVHPCYLLRGCPAFENVCTYRSLYWRARGRPSWRHYTVCMTSSRWPFDGNIEPFGSYSLYNPNLPRCPPWEARSVFFACLRTLACLASPVELYLHCLMIT